MLWTEAMKPCLQWEPPRELKTNGLRFAFCTSQMENWVRVWPEPSPTFSQPLVVSFISAILQKWGVAFSSLKNSYIGEAVSLR